MVELMMGSGLSSFVSNRRDLQKRRIMALFPPGKGQNSRQRWIEFR